MIWKTAGALIAVMMCVTAPRALGEPRGGERSGGEKSEGQRSHNESSANKKQTAKKPPGGNWSDESSEGRQGKGQPGSASNDSHAKGAAGYSAEQNKSPQASGAQGAAAGAAAANRNAPAASGKEGAAAGAAGANRNQSTATGAQGAAAGAAAANRNAPAATGAQGAAAGAAAANRNAPAASGAQGAAAGAAFANRNAPPVSGAQGAAAGAAVANRNTPAFSGAQGATAGYAVRNSFDHPDLYGGQWYGDHQGAWSPAGWAAGAAWTPATWGAVAGQFGYGASAPVTYNYGSNVTCVQGNVIVDGQPAGTAEEFSQQAADLAERGAAAEASPADQWLPLGVFALVRNEQQHPQLILQLAVNKQGIVRGNYTDEVTDNTQPVQGAVDPKTQRAAWTVGDNRYSIMEAGLANLTESEAPALLHKNGTTQKWLLVRLEQPAQGGK